MGCKAVGPVCRVMHVKEPRTFIINISSDMWMAEVCALIVALHLFASLEAQHDGRSLAECIQWKIPWMVWPEPWIMAEELLYMYIHVHVHVCTCTCTCTYIHVHVPYQRCILFIVVSWSFPFKSYRTPIFKELNNGIVPLSLTCSVY